MVLNHFIHIKEANWSTFLTQSDTNVFHLFLIIIMLWLPLDLYFFQLRSNNRHWYYVKIPGPHPLNKPRAPFDTISWACWAFFFVERLWLYFSLLSNDGVYAQIKQKTVFYCVLEQSVPFMALWSSQFHWEWRYIVKADWSGRLNKIVDIQRYSTVQGHLFMFLAY